MILERIPISNPGGTFTNYINYLRKACFYLERPVRWHTPAAANLIKGLKLAGIDKFKFPNFVDIHLIVRIIRHETRFSEFAQLAYVAFLVALRAPSEALAIGRAYKGDELAQFPPQADRALICLMAYPAKNASRCVFWDEKTYPVGALCPDLVSVRYR